MEEEINLCDTLCDTCKRCQDEDGNCTGLPFGITECDKYKNINS